MYRSAALPLRPRRAAPLARMFSRNLGILGDSYRLAVAPVASEVGIAAGCSVGGCGAAHGWPPSRRWSTVRQSSRTPLTRPLLMISTQRVLGAQWPLAVSRGSLTEDTSAGLT